jgi:hypothetical protein
MLYNVFLPLLQFSSGTITSQMFHVHLQLNTSEEQPVAAREPSNTNAFPDMGEYRGKHFAQFPFNLKSFGNVAEYMVGLRWKWLTGWLG